MELGTTFPRRNRHQDAAASGLPSPPASSSEVLGRGFRVGLKPAPSVVLGIALCWLFLGAWCKSAGAFEVTGLVLQTTDTFLPSCDPNDPNDVPLQGVTVRIRGRTVTTTTGTDGRFHLLDPDFTKNGATIAAGLEGNVNNSQFAIWQAGQTPPDILICLPVIPADNPSFKLSASDPDACQICHHDPDGSEPVTILQEWRKSRHANAGTNSWVEAALIDYRSRVPVEQAESRCADCHTPAAFDLGVAPGSMELTELAADSLARKHGVQCGTCHRVREVTANIKAINFDGGAIISHAPLPIFAFGPWNDVTDMATSPVAAFTDSLFCAPCHEHDAPAIAGSAVIPGQTTYSEWERWQQRLPASSPLKGTPDGTCQGCHMPAKPLDQPNVACAFAAKRDRAFPVRAHTAAGTWLGPGELLPNGRYSLLDGAAALDLEVAQIATGEIEVSAQLMNLAAGHKLPTGSGIRNLILVIEAFDAAGVEIAPLGDPVRTSFLPDWTGSFGTMGAEDLAGKAGKGYAKIFSRDRADFGNPDKQWANSMEAQCVVQDSALEGGLSDTTSAVFPVNPAAGAVKILARVLYRRAFAGFFGRLGLPETDALGNPIADFEVARRTLEITPVSSPEPLPGGVDLDFQMDAAGAQLADGQVVDNLFAALGVTFSSLSSSNGQSCTTADGSAYVVNGGGGDLVLSPKPGLASHNECTGGILRLDFSPPVGLVLFDVEADNPGAGFEIRAMDGDGKEIALSRIYDDPANCQSHPAGATISLELAHRRVSSVEVRGTVKTAADQGVAWTIRRLRYRFDSFHPESSGPVETPTPTPTPAPGNPTPTPTSTPTPPVPGISEPVLVGQQSVLVTAGNPPGSRIEIRASGGPSTLRVLGASTAGENGEAEVRLLTPLAGGESIYPFNLRTLMEGPAITVIAPTPTTTPKPLPLLEQPGQPSRGLAVLALMGALVGVFTMIIGRKRNGASFM